MPLLYVDIYFCGECEPASFSSVCICHWWQQTARFTLSLSVGSHSRFCNLCCRDTRGSSFPEVVPLTRIRPRLKRLKLLSAPLCTSLETNLKIFLIFFRLNQFNKSSLGAPKSSLCFWSIKEPPRSNRLRRTFSLGKKYGYLKVLQSVSEARVCFVCCSVTPEVWQISGNAASRLLRATSANSFSSEVKPFWKGGRCASVVSCASSQWFTETSFYHQLCTKVFLSAAWCGSFTSNCHIVSVLLLANKKLHMRAVVIRDVRILYKYYCIVIAHI